MTIRPRRAALKLLAMSALWIAFLACSEAETETGGTTPREVQGLCSASEPTVGTKCAKPMTCQYGDAVRPECRPTYGCAEQTGWLWEKRPACEQPPAGYCPATRPEATSCAVGTPGVPCEYGDVLCICPCGFPNVDGECGPEVWRCDEPPTTAGCPAIAPNYGSACSIQGLECNYGQVCDWGVSRLCFRGVWIRGSFEGTACAQ